MKTKILMFGWEFPPHNSGGLGVACYALTKSLSERGFDVTFVMPKKLDVRAPWARFVFAGIDVRGRVINSPITPYIGSGYARARGDSAIYGEDLLSEVRRYGALGAEIAREESFDIIYAHDWLSFGAGVAAKEATGKPLVVHVHATEFDRCGGRSGINEQVYEIEKRGMEEANRVIAVSEYTRQLIIREYGIPENKVHVVHNGIEEDASEPEVKLDRLRNLKNAGYSIVLFLGRITLQKGPDYFVRAAKEVLKREKNVVFFLSGSGDMERHIMDLAAELGIAQHVFFTGFLRGSDRTEVYRAAALFVMPSVSEPFGITALEAMRSGTPVLMSKQSGVSEVVKHALKVDFWDVDEMTNKILGVIRHKGLGRALSENAKAEAQRLTWDIAGEKVGNILHEYA